MNCNIVLHMVDDLNCYTIAFSCNEPRSRKLPVNGKSALRVAQPCQVTLHNLA